MVKKVKAQITTDITSKRLTTGTFTDELKKSNTLTHEFTQKLLKKWHEHNPDHFDMIGGQLRLDMRAHADNSLSNDRIDDDKNHYITIDDPFANICITPLKLNTRFALMKIFGSDKHFNKKVRDFVKEDLKKSTNVKKHIEEYKKLPKSLVQNNKLYTLYHSCKTSSKKRYKKLGIEDPNPQQSYEQFLEEFFKLYRKQFGRCAISQIRLGFNYDGPRQFHISIDRIDPTNLNYGDWNNNQIVITALNVIDHERDKKYIDIHDGSASITAEWFQNYFRII